MLTIACHLHLQYHPGKPVGLQLFELESNQELIDPCSGTQYKWNEQKQLLYSPGLDRQDDQGETRGYNQIKGSDYALPIILYLK